MTTTRFVLQSLADENFSAQVRNLHGRARRLTSGIGSLWLPRRHVRLAHQKQLQDLSFALRLSHCSETRGGVLYERVERLTPPSSPGPISKLDRLVARATLGFHHSGGPRV